MAVINNQHNLYVSIAENLAEMSEDDRRALDCLLACRGLSATTEIDFAELRQNGLTNTSTPEQARQLVVDYQVEIPRKQLQRVRGEIQGLAAVLRTLSRDCTAPIAPGKEGERLRTIGEQISGIARDLSRLQ